MTPDRRATLQVLGNVLVVDILDVSTYVLFFGVFIGLWILACLDFLNCGFGNSRARWALVAALLLTFLTGVVSVLTPMANFIIVVTHLNPLDSATLDAKLAPYDIAVSWASQIGLLINDIVVIWRAWVLYRDRPIVLFSLCLIFCGTVATGFGCLALISTVSTFIEFDGTVSSSGISDQSTVARALNNVASILSLVTNVFATSLIVLQLWRHRRFIGRSLHRNSLTPSERIMLFLVEAGFIFCIGQALDLFIWFYTGANNITLLAVFVFDLIEGIFWGSLPMYLPVVILLAANNRTIDQYVSYNSSLLAEAADMEVAGHQGGPAESSTVSDPGTDRLSAHGGSNNRSTTLGVNDD